MKRARGLKKALVLVFKFWLSTSKSQCWVQCWDATPAVGCPGLSTQAPAQIHQDKVQPAPSPNSLQPQPGLHLL